MLLVLARCKHDKEALFRVHKKKRAAHSATKIIVGRWRRCGLHKFGLTIKMISLSKKSLACSQKPCRGTE